MAPPAPPASPASLPTLRAPISVLLGLFVCLTLAPSAGRAQVCAYSTDHGTAEFVGFQETWQDPDCPECDPLPLLRIDEDGFGSDHLFFTPGQSGQCIDTLEFSDPDAVYGWDALIECKDKTLDYVWRAFNPEGISLTLSDGLRISEEYETREDSSGNPGLLVPFDELRSSDGLPLFPSTGTYEIRRQLVGCGDESGAEQLGKRCSVSPEIACDEDSDCPGTETCEEGHWGQWIRVEVTKKFQNGLVRFSDSAVDNDAALDLYTYTADSLLDICTVEDHVDVVVDARGLCSALDPAPSIVSYAAGFVPEQCGISSFQWQVMAESSVVWENIAGETGEGLDQSVVGSLLPPAGWTGFRRDATSTTGVDGATNEMTVAVLGDFFPEVSPVGQNVCQEATGTVADLVVSHTTDTAQQLLYQWQSRPAGGGANDWADIAGATAAALGPGPDTLEYRAKVWAGIAGLPQSWNLALDGTASQSTTYPGGNSNQAIDGNTDGFWSNGSVSHTNTGDPAPWWEVDLQGLSYIEAINVWNRTDCCSDRLTNFRVSILDGAGTPVYSADAFTEGGFPLQRVDFIPVPSTPPGKTVRIELLAPLGPEPFLQLAEVEVLGYQVCGPFVTPPARVVVGPEAAEYFPDADGDGYPNKTVAPVTLCEAQAGFAPGILQGDCDDADPEEFPGQRWFTDQDQDGLAPRGALSVQQCPQPAFTTPREPGDPFDCDDTDPDVTGVVLWAEDVDGDRYSTGTTRLSCARPLGFIGAGAVLGADCNDGDADEFPNRTWYPDIDGDGHGQNSLSVISCLRPADHFLAEELVSIFDCNDSEPQYARLQDWYRDEDDDGYAADDGGAPDSVETCLPTPVHTKTADDLASTVEVDCDDTNPDQFPDQSWYPDGDGDGQGSAFIDPYLACQPLQASDVSNHRDCNDQDPDPTICDAGPGPGSALLLTPENQLTGLAIADGDELGVFGDSDFLVEAWIRKPPSASGQAIVSKGSACAPANSWGLRTTPEGAAAAFALGGVGESVELESTTVVADGEWHHVALRRIDDRFSLWVDSQMEAAKRASAALQIRGARPVVVGNDFPFGGDDCLPPFVGRIDGVRIWTARRDLGLSGPDFRRIVEGTSLGLDAYWAFDRTATLGGPVFAVDSAAGFPLRLDAGELANSTAPIGTGDGEISLFLGAANPTPDILHALTGVALLGAVPVGDDRVTLVSTRLRVPPSGPGPIAADRSRLTGAYWILDLIGVPPEIDGDLILEFPDDEISDSMQAHPGDLELYIRPKNSDGAWTFVATASAASAADEQVRFNNWLVPEAQLAVVITDLDGDLVGDSGDNCPDFATPDVNDADGNGRGDACECGDQTGDGFVNIQDILAINRVIFGLEAARPLCDANNDAICNILDILAVNTRIFGGDTFCARFPPPGP